MQFGNLFSVRKAWKCVVYCNFAVVCLAQTDPGPRGGPAGAGTPFSTLTAGELDFFTNHGVPQFSQVEAVADGLGPRFNLASSRVCHIQPSLAQSTPASTPHF